MRRVKLKTLCGATQEVEVNDGPIQAPIVLPFRVGARPRGVVFRSSCVEPSLDAPVSAQIVTRTFECQPTAHGNAPVYIERYEGPSPDQQAADKIIASENREIERLKTHEAAWQSAVHEAVNGNGVGRYGDADCAVITGERLHELLKCERSVQAYLEETLGPVVGVDLKTGMQVRRKQVKSITIDLGAGPGKPIGNLALSMKESGPGLRDGSGKYTEPGEPMVYVDHGWDD